MPQHRPTVSASTAIPSPLRVMLLYVEPLFALSGVATVLLNPDKYTSTLTRGNVIHTDPRLAFLWTTVVGGWLHFAFTEAVVLRLVDDLGVWRLLCIGMLLSDLAYTHSCAQALGGWAEWVDVTRWTSEDWVVTVTTWPFIVVRMAIVFGIGVRVPKGGMVAVT
ncbi:hypothetical protein BAUCODRAFT_75051 [Baudoinia panamericana UAMH 10762]|uniref:DUF7704 domain-containing protein n=1 Tax=Baudoinia panamericana (strain UAMH 10762) TaxID=717646 RepID=M2N4W2_BAUPA|nr:uncharacterized protein BAUCODRAFT_75051 [Baudoinia panamericana UAMH 10762]EMC93800.1 hypothetical protein BAUCODRAFT_75051 [Baudoinia panamericana UAMH 10762]